MHNMVQPALQVTELCRRLSYVALCNQKEMAERGKIRVVGVAQWGGAYGYEATTLGMEISAAAIPRARCWRKSFSVLCSCPTEACILAFGRSWYNCCLSKFDLVKGQLR